MKQGETDPVREVRIEPSARNPLALTVTIELADHVAACCVNADTAFVEFQGDGHHIRLAFEFMEGRPGHQFVANLTVPAAGLYTYRLMAKILDRTLTREGTYEAAPKPSPGRERNDA